MEAVGKPVVFLLLQLLHNKFKGVKLSFVFGDRLLL
jgi:hypothetical protein